MAKRTSTIAQMGRLPDGRILYATAYERISPRTGLPISFPKTVITHAWTAEDARIRFWQDSTRSVRTHRIVGCAPAVGVFCDKNGEKLTA
jgi:hypothetical protein